MPSFPRVRATKGQDQRPVVGVEFKRLRGAPFARVACSIVSVNGTEEPKARRETGKRRRGPQPLKPPNLASLDALRASHVRRTGKVTLPVTVPAQVSPRPSPKAGKGGGKPPTVPAPPSATLARSPKAGKDPVRPWPSQAVFDSTAEGGKGR